MHKQKKTQMIVLNDTSIEDGFKESKSVSSFELVNNIAHNVRLNKNQALNERNEECCVPKEIQRKKILVRRLTIKWLQIKVLAIMNKHAKGERNLICFTKRNLAEQKLCCFCQRINSGLLIIAPQMTNEILKYDFVARDFFIEFKEFACKDQRH